MNNDAKTFSYLSYIGPLFLIGMFSDIRNDPILRFHMNQGLVLFLCELAGLILHALINSLLGGIILLNIIPGILFFFIGFVSLVLSLIGLFNVATNKMNVLPVIGGITILK